MEEEPQKYTPEWFAWKGRQGGLKAAKKLRESGLLQETMENLSKRAKAKRLTRKTVGGTVDASKATGT